jgi:hypothetical protein
MGEECSAGGRVFDRQPRFKCGSGRYGKDEPDCTWEQVRKEDICATEKLAVEC